MDTLDNMAFNFAGNQTTIFGGLSAENALRVKAQNERKISVIIGNPPYNANQQNENDNNKNREYFGDRKKKLGGIDGRIRQTFIAQSTAQKTKVYDMYARFFRWAMDRIDAEKGGIIAYITNRSFIDSRTFDGFRKCIQDEFSFAYIVDTKSDVRANPKISGTKNNVFGIQAGVAVMFLVKLPRKETRPGDKCQIRYVSMPDEWTRLEKLTWFQDNPLKTVGFDFITPDKDNNWINMVENDFETMLPLASKDVKLGRSEDALFKLFSLGVVTARDEWVYDESSEHLAVKVNHLIDKYNADVQIFKALKDSTEKAKFDTKIKWTRAVKGDLVKGKIYKFQKGLIIDSLYRPFVKRKLYFSNELNEMQYQLPHILKGKNLSINFLCVSSQNALSTMATNTAFDYCLLKMGNGGTVSLPLYRYDAAGNRIDNITDWGRAQFVAHYGDDSITKEAIFHYTYAVLHHPAYRTKYELNLKREFPRLPFYGNFGQWAAWGQALMDLHIGYETVTPYALVRRDAKNPSPGPSPVGRGASSPLFSSEQTPLPNGEGSGEGLRAEGFFPHQLAQTPVAAKAPKPRLKADEQAGQIEIDDVTTLSGIPPEAWQYRLGNRSALAWVLDQYKEKKPSDPTIAERFDTYRFADYKEHVIDLLARVCTVSVETMRIVAQMPG